MGSAPSQSMAPLSPVCNATHPAVTLVSDKLVATDNLVNYGCSALDCQLDENTLNRVLKSCANYKPHRGNMRHPQWLRYSMNNESHVHDSAWRGLLSNLLASDLFVSSISAWVRTIDPKGRWFFFGFGGDTVMPGDPGQELHSDYWGADMHIIAVSIAVSDPIVDAGPLRIIPGLAPKKRDDYYCIPCDSLAHKVLLPKGAVFVRDVNVWHSGTANTTTNIRYLPMIRFATRREKCSLSFRSIEHTLWMQYFGKASDNVKHVMYQKWTKDLSREERHRMAIWSLVIWHSWLDEESIARLRQNSRCFVQL